MPLANQYQFAAMASILQVLGVDAGFSPIASVIACLLCAAGILLVVQRWRAWRRLRHVPGPRHASLTNLVRARWALTGEPHLILQRHHETYGDLVRIGPNMVSFSSPEAISTVYPAKPGFLKGDFYAVLRPYTRGRGKQYLVFNTQDEDRLKILKKPIAPLYANHNVVAFEPLVDEVLRCFDEQIQHQFAGNPAGFNLGQWLQYFAFDSVGMMTFSRKYGFIDHGHDFDGIIKSVNAFMLFNAPMTQVPRLDPIRKSLVGNAVERFLGYGASTKLIEFAAKVFQDRKAGVVSDGEKAMSSVHGAEDFLSRFIKLQEASPEIPPWAPISWTFSNVVAGSDSSASIMRTVMFNLLTNPQTMDRLYQELRLSCQQRPFPAYREIRNLPYLDACVLEGARLHPPFALPFERVVPEGGITVLGYYLPAGTVVGGNPYVVNRYKATFGQDAEVWRPERWTEGGQAHRTKLEQGLLTFGAGRRVCLGKHIGILNIKKMLSYLILNYNIRVIDPSKYHVENFWFFFSEGLIVSVEKRHRGKETPN